MEWKKSLIEQMPQLLLNENKKIYEMTANYEDQLETSMLKLEN